MTLANGPRGTLAALRVAWIQTVAVPPCSAAASASRASRDLPTPASASSTIPGVPTVRAAAMRSSSPARPINGQPRLAPSGADNEVGPTNAPLDYTRPVRAPGTQYWSGGDAVAAY